MSAAVEWSFEFRSGSEISTGNTFIEKLARDIFCGLEEGRSFLSGLKFCIRTVHYVFASYILPATIPFVSCSVHSRGSVWRSSTSNCILQWEDEVVTKKTENFRRGRFADIFVSCWKRFELNSRSWQKDLLFEEESSEDGGYFEVERRSCHWGG
ncbi:unnamed protein product [Allacma fusca]|uniref:Uncharacterized protein n=1 Tax=Allacma fusca TaxID=39272 RepID=A0A8J2NYR5_9HEXA|nr:unnamed protein product [Allacma fusca]